MAMRKLIRESSENGVAIAMVVWSMLWLMTFLFSFENEIWMIANFIVILSNFAITYHSKAKLLTVVQVILSGAYILFNWQIWMKGNIELKSMYGIFAYAALVAVAFVLLFFRFANEPEVDE